MESRSWYEQQRMLERVSEESRQPASHTVDAGRYSGSRAERRAKAAEDRRIAKRKKSPA
jgi:hypothetical protein